MKDYKENIWKEDGVCLTYESLDKVQITRMMNYISKTFGLSKKSLNASSMFVEIFDEFDKKGIVLNINNSNGFKEICSLLNINLDINELVYVIWDFDDVDKISIDDLCRNWDYIWYGVSDEMCLLCLPQFPILLLITDYGTVYIK